MTGFNWTSPQPVKSPVKSPLEKMDTVAGVKVDSHSDLAGVVAVSFLTGRPLVQSQLPGNPNGELVQLKSELSS